MKVYQAINAVQRDLAAVGLAKDQRNSAQGFKFRGVDDVYNALSPLLAKHHLCFLPRVIGRTMVERTTDKNKAMYYVTVQAEYDLVSAEDGSKHTIAAFGEASDFGDKATSKAMSMAYKYAAFEAFCIPTEGENDADYHTPEHNVPTGQAAPAPQAPPPMMTAGEIAQWEAFIDEQNDEQGLRAAYSSAYKTAAALGDEKAIAAFTKAKDAKKAAFETINKAKGETA